MNSNPRGDSNHLLLARAWFVQERIAWHNRNRYADPFVIRMRLRSQQTALVRHISLWERRR
jgi:hypothetical protein